MKTEIPNWVTEYNNAGHQSSAARAIKILMTRIGELENGWISVKDRLPETKYGWSVKDVLCITAYTYEIGRTRDGNWINMQNIPIPVTHWMPLPNPPQQ